MRSIFSTVLFSVTLSPTNGHASPLSLSTSFWGSINTTAVSFLFMFIVASFERVTTYLHAARRNRKQQRKRLVPPEFCTVPGALLREPCGVWLFTKSVGA